MQEEVYDPSALHGGDSAGNAFASGNAPAADGDDDAGPLPDFYLRYYVGHAGRFGHEFLEYEIREDGTIRYGNHSKYRDKTAMQNPSGLIKKRLTVSPIVLEEFKRIVRASNIANNKSETWPKPDRSGRQELELVLDGQHMMLSTNMTSTAQDIARIADAEGFQNFTYLVHDTKQLILSLMQMHHRIRAV